MKKTVKIVSLLLAVLMLFSVSACKSVSDSKGPYVLKFGDFTISEGEYSYILSYLKSYVVYSYQNYFYNTDTKLYSESEILSMPAPSEPDLTVAQFIDKYAIEVCRQLLTVEKLCADADITITDESRLANVSDYIADIEYAYGGKDLFDIKLLKLGFDKSGIERFKKFDDLFDLFYDYRYGDNGEVRVSDEEVVKYFTENYVGYDGAYFLYTDKNNSSESLKFEYSDDEVKDYFLENFVKITHVLYKTVDNSGKELSEQTVAEKKAKAEAALEEINSGNKTVSDFSADNEDSGSEYVFTKGRMVKEFETAAFEMKPGETRLVKTSYGYHLMYKTSLKAEELEDKEVDGKKVEGYKNQVLAAMTEKAIYAEAEELYEKLSSGETSDFPKSIEGKDYYIYMSPIFIDKADTSYNAQTVLKVLDELKVGEYRKDNYSGAMCSMIRKLAPGKDDINAETTETIREELSQKAFYAYVESFYESIELNEDVYNKFDAKTASFLESEFIPE